MSQSTHGRLEADLKGPLDVIGGDAALPDEERAAFADAKSEFQDSPAYWTGIAASDVSNKGVQPRVTDEGLAFLVARQTELEELDLRDSGVTDKGLWLLRTLTGLKHLDVRGAPVTEEGVARLAGVLPDCEILR